MSRSKNSIKNFCVALIFQGIAFIVSFAARFVFIKMLSDEYLGLNGFFTNLLSILSLAELGVGEAITYSLYKPLADNDVKKCSSLMQLYCIIYRIIGIAIFLIGLLIIPLLPFLIKDMNGLNNVTLIYILFLFNTSLSYLMSYKRNLIIADQKRYIATIYRYSFFSILNIVQIFILIFTKNYILFLVAQILFTFLENFFLSIKADKMYSYLNKKADKLDNNSKKEIIKNTKAMLMHKIGGVVINSTDNLILTKFTGLVTVGLYSNYYLLINGINVILSQVFTSMMASVGNLCVTSDSEKQENVFKSMFFLNYWMYSFCSICFLFLVNPFISIWLGDLYLFNSSIVLVLFLNFYVTGMRKCVLTFREAMGLFEKDKWKAIIESVLNILFSIILVVKIGVLGVFLGTLISSLLVCFWVEPYVLYKYGFKKNVFNFFKTYLFYSILTVIQCIIFYFLFNLIPTGLYVTFIIRLIVCLFVPNILIIVLFHKSQEFNYIISKLPFINKFSKSV